MTIKELLDPMVDAAKEVLGEKWPEAKTFARTELKALAEGTIMISKMRVAGQITDEQAGLLVEMKKNTVRMVLLTLEGLGLLAVEEALNAALNAVKDTVNTATGFALL